MSENWQILLLSGLALIIRLAERDSLGMDPEKQVETKVFIPNFWNPSTGSWNGFFPLSGVLNAQLHNFYKIQPIIGVDFDGQVWTEKAWTKNSQLISSSSFGMTWSEQKHQERECLCSKPQMCSVRLSLIFFKFTHGSTDLLEDCTDSGRGCHGKQYLGRTQGKLEAKGLEKIKIFQVIHSETVSFPLKMEIFNPGSTET